MALSGKKIVAVAGTPAPLGSQLVAGLLCVRALTGNTGLVYLGDAASAASASGYPLLPGDQVVFRQVSNLGAVWVDAAVSGEGVAWLVLGA